METTRHETRFQVNALSRNAFQKALNSCFGGELLMLACLAPTLELDAKSIILRQPPRRGNSKNNWMPELRPGSRSQLGLLPHWQGDADHKELHTSSEYWFSNL